MKKVSVIIPAYNRAHCIQKTIDSVLLQSYKNFDIIVVDDASTDGTSVLFNNYKDDRVKYIKHDTNKGGAAARNTGVRHSSGEYIAFLDSDDLWLPTKLESQITLLEKKGNSFGLCYTWFIIQDTEGNEIMKVNHRLTGQNNTALLEKNYIGTFSSVVIRRDIFLAVDGLDDQMKSCQDWDLFIRVNEVTNVCYVDEYLVSYLQDKSDKFRISSNKYSVIAGHCRLYEKNKSKISLLPSEDVFKILKTYIHTFVVIGSVKYLIKFSTLMLENAVDVKSLTYVATSFLRLLKRKLKNNFGY
jgi:glycosyltransferase involved in cell wall biosynthesis